MSKRNPNAIVNICVFSVHRRRCAHNKALLACLPSEIRLYAWLLLLWLVQIECKVIRRFLSCDAFPNYRTFSVSRLKGIAVSLYLQFVAVSTVFHCIYRLLLYLQFVAVSAVQFFAVSAVRRCICSSSLHLQFVAVSAVHRCICSLSLYLQFVHVSTVHHCIYRLLLYLQCADVFTVRRCMYSLSLYLQFVAVCTVCRLPYMCIKKKTLFSVDHSSR